MRKLINFLIVVYYLFFSSICLMGDVAVPSSAKNIWVHQNLNRNSFYLVDNIYFGDGSANTMLLQAPNLADDNTIFTLPATNGTANYFLITDGSGNTSWSNTLTLANQNAARFYEQTGNGTNYIALIAPDAVTTTTTFKLPDGDGAADQLIKTDGSGNLGWVAPLTNPMDSEGDMIVGGAGGAAAKLDSGTDGYLLKAKGAANPEWSEPGITGLVPAGTIISFAAATCPTGWLAANGQEISQATYATLYAVIGSTWNTSVDPETGSAQSAPAGGNFRVPNLESTFLRGAGTPAVGEAVTLAGWQTDKYQGHWFEIRTTTASRNTYIQNTTGSATPLPQPVSAGSSGPEYMIANYPRTDGTNGTPRYGTETRPQNIGVKYCIKY